MALMLVCSIVKSQTYIGAVYGNEDKAIVLNVGWITGKL